MDGTITPARKPMKKDMMLALRDLQWADYEIGIVTGSDMNYLIDQCDILFGLNGYQFHKTHYLPCNGTKYYKYNESGSLSTVYENDMIEAIGKQTYRAVIQSCIDIQKHIIDTTNCPLTGNFFDYRGSTLNWCPIGRLAKKDERDAWLKIDINNKFRLKWINHLKEELKKKGVNNIEIKLGGETSFDIHPKGWDKTYCLKNFKEYNEIIFIGDRCFDNGNDKELYDTIIKHSIGKAYQTKDPENTIEIIKEYINEARRR